MQLDSPIAKIFRTDDGQKKALTKLGLVTLRDLLFYLPSRYGSTSEIKQIADTHAGELVTLFGRISGSKTKKAFRRKIPMGEATLEDLSGKIKIIWFHQAYMAKIISDGDTVRVTGKISAGKNGLYLSNPEIEKTIDMSLEKSALFGEGKETNEPYPVYPESRGISSSWIYHKIKKVLASEAFKELADYLPETILQKYNLPTLRTALVWIHAPEIESHALAARKRFAFEEIFFIQLIRQRDRIQFKKNKSFQIAVKKDEVADFTSRFPFKPTLGQEKAIEAILADLEKDQPMSRLLEGDVGSGKTFVAAIASHAVVTNAPASNKFASLQVAYMAPTEILATQHFDSFIKYFAHLDISVGLITGSGAKKFPSKTNPLMPTDISKAQLLKWVAEGTIPILFGTHALIQKKVAFKHLALAIVDEQHRFGTNQRAKLTQKESAGKVITPHFLSMTATPIPRTLALTLYGDLDLTLLDEMPHGRKKIITQIVMPEERARAYTAVKKELAAGRQMYVICPRIDEPDPTKENALNTKSVLTEAKRLEEEVFQDETIGVLHSKMTPEKKEQVMKQFSEGAIRILVATSVVEVGVNVPNATVIIIEGAERFGLAQLHQLRGRVGRSEDQAYCYIFSNTKSEKSIERLQALTKAKNGFELSELDLALRGAGDLAGAKQWGISDIGMEAIKNLKMVEAARTEAREIVAADPELERYPLLQEKMAHAKHAIHFE